MTEPKIIGTDNLSVVDYWKARAEALEADLLHEAQKCAALDTARLRAEAELAQSQAEVAKLQTRDRWMDHPDCAAALRGAWAERDAERALADTLGEALDDHALCETGVCPSCEAVARWKQARPGVQGEEGDEVRS